MAVKILGVVTVARSDYGILRPVLRAIRSSADLELRLYVTGAHLSPHFGRTVREIEEDGMPIAARIVADYSPGNSLGAAEIMAAITSGLARIWAADRPDLLLIMGDRYEMMAAATAAAVFNIPVAHIHGGEVTTGAIDDMFRHAITKLSHLHFVAHQEYARRVRQLGEEAWRIEICGAPGLDNIAAGRRIAVNELSKRFGLDLSRPEQAPVLATYHLPTVPYQGRDAEFPALVEVLEDYAEPVIWTFAGADPGGERINAEIQKTSRRRNHWLVLPHIDMDEYFCLMRHARAMIGNSSGGLLEAGSFELPVVNIGRRQEGRIRGAQVIDVPSATIAAIRQALARATDGGFRASLQGMRNPFGDGGAAPRILDGVRRHSDPSRLLHKAFVDHQ